jgi:hypothetical protein
MLRDLEEYQWGNMTIVVGEKTKSKKSKRNRCKSNMKIAFQESLKKGSFDALWDYSVLKIAWKNGSEVAFLFF